MPDPARGRRLVSDRTRAEAVGPQRDELGRELAAVAQVVAGGRRRRPAGPRPRVGGPAGPAREDLPDPPAKPRRSASSRCPTHSLALHSPGRRPASRAGVPEGVAARRPRAVGVVDAPSRRGDRAPGRAAASAHARSRGRGDGVGHRQGPTAVGDRRLGQPARRRPARRRRRTAAAPRPGSGRTPSGQRGWNRQPVGMCAASGVSPTRIVRSARVAGGRRVGRGRDRHEGRGVRVARRADDRLGRADLHDLAEVHHRDPVGDDPGQRQVVGDEQVGQPALRAQVEHQPQQLGPDRDVEHRDRLVGDDDARGP